MLRTPRDMVEATGLVIMFLRATMLLRGLRDLEELSGAAVHLWMSTTMVPLKDMEEPIGMVTMVLQAALLLRGRKDLEELIKWFGDQFVGLTNAEGTKGPSGMVVVLLGLTILLRCKGTWRN